MRATPGLKVRTTPAAVFALVVAGALHASPARAQSIAVETELTTGVSTQGAAAASTQLRAFGDPWAGVEFFVEGSWAARHDDDQTDVFGSAYPYANKVQLIEAYGERLFRPGRALLGVKAGRFRTPFGMYNRSDHAYTGLRNDQVNARDFRVVVEMSEQATSVDRTAGSRNSDGDCFHWRGHSIAARRPI